MDQQSFTTSAFWNDDTNCVLGGGLSEVPDLVDVSGAVIFKTSGSTGKPKWVVHEKRGLLVSAKAVNEWLEVDQKSTWGLALPIDHMGGFSILARVFQASCGLEKFGEKWNAEKFCHWLGEKSVTHASLVPTQVHDLVGASLIAPKHLRAVVVGGGKLAETLGQAARDLGWPVLASYGMTEAGSQIATQSPKLVKNPFAQSSLEILPIWQLKIDSENQIYISGDALFRGYLFQDECGVRFEPRLQTAFLTNDRGIISGNDFKPLGRVDTLVKVLGILVDLEAVERRFLKIAAGRISENHFAVIALPDQRKEHVLVAVFKGEIPTECVADYQRVAPSLEQFAEVYQIEKIPRSALGKIQRGELLDVCQKSFE